MTALYGCHNNHRIERQKRLWSPCLLETSRKYIRAVVIKAHPCHRQHVQTFWKGHTWVTNQSILRVRTLADQSDRTSDLHKQSGQVRSNTLPLSASCVALHPLVRCLSHLAVVSSLPYTSVLITANTQCLSLGTQFILEKTGKYCWMLVLLGLQRRKKLTGKRQLYMAIFMIRSTQMYTSYYGLWVTLLHYENAFHTFN